MPVVTIHPPKMHHKQANIYLHPSRFKVISAGRRFGKTMLAARKLTECAVKGKQSFWVAPTYQIAEIGWNAMLKMAAQIDGAKFNKADKVVSIGSGWVKVRSADSEGGLRGEGLDYLIMDEAAHIRNLKDVWEQELRPSLADRQGGAMFISTPKGYNYFFELWKQAETDPAWHSWQVPSWDNPYLAAEEIEAARRSLPGLVFRQEFGAEFVQLAGAMFRREYFQIIEPAEVPYLKNTVRFWDLAASTKTLADYTAGCKLGMDEDGNIYVTDMVHARYEWPQLVRVFKTTATNDGGAVTQGIETTGTQRGFLDLMLAEPTLAGLAIQGYTPDKDKITRAQPLLARAEQGKVKVVRSGWTNDFIDELCAFEPDCDHDDQVDAASGALYMIGNTAEPRIRLL